jgi:DnaJ-class molecular chaperone
MANYKTCDECNGTGTALLQTDEGPYNRIYEGDCPECDGTGEINPRRFLLDENE